MAAGRYPHGTRGDTVLRFIEGLCRHVKGPKAGQLIVLEPWQRAIINDLFELRDDGLRRYRQALIGLPRKQGKSTVGAGIALFGLLDPDELGAEVYAVAGDRDQARIVFGAARRMVEMEPELAEVLRIYRDVIEYPTQGAVYRVLSADAPRAEGLNPSLVVFDELHVQPNRELWDVMTLGSGTRTQPLVMAITTAGYDRESICYQLYDYGKKLQGGELSDPSFYFRWYEPTRPDFDYRDPKVWAECNPGLGTVLRPDDLEESCRRVPMAVFCRYRLNAWTDTEESWLPPGAWAACLDEEADLDPSLPLAVGIDVSLKHDSTAVVAAQRQGERFVIRAQVFENPYPEADPRHQEWRVPLPEVHQLLRDLRAAYPVPAAEIDGAPAPGPSFWYDPSFFQESALRLQDEGLAMVEFPQSPARMAPAVQLLYQLVVEGKLAHDADPALARHVANAVPKPTDRGFTLRKAHGQRSRKIDAAVAAAIAVAAAQQPAPKAERSVYETRGIITIG
ncbi:MAG: terminase large subunit [Chloroflexi bacterium]|nr:terminase large subunit [Chloroflexota bacterium]